MIFNVLVLFSANKCHLYLPDIVDMLMPDVESPL